MYLHISRHAVVLLLGAALFAPTLAGAAGSRALAAPSAQSPKACSVLTGSDVRAATGLRVMRTRSGTQGPFSTCSYAAGGRNFYFLIADQSAIRAKSAFNTTASYWKNTVTSPALQKSQKIKRLGDAAVWSKQLGQMWVLKGSTMLSLAEFPSRADSLRLLTAAANRALNRV